MNFIIPTITSSWISSAFFTANSVGRHCGRGQAAVKGYPMKTIFTGWAKKSGPLLLTVYIFKTFQLICVIFGTLQQCFVLNTSVLNKFITPMAPPTDKINN